MLIDCKDTIYLRCSIYSILKKIRDIIPKDQKKIEINNLSDRLKYVFILFVFYNKLVI